MTDEQQQQLEALKTARIAAEIEMLKSGNADAWTPVNELLDAADHTTREVYRIWVATHPLKDFKRRCLPWPPE